MTCLLEIQLTCSVPDSISTLQLLNVSLSREDRTSCPSCQQQKKKPGRALPTALLHNQTHNNAKLGLLDICCHACLMEVSSLRKQDKKKRWNEWSSKHASSRWTEKQKLRMGRKERKTPHHTTPHRVSPHNTKPAKLIVKHFLRSSSLLILFKPSLALIHICLPSHHPLPSHKASFPSFRKIPSIYSDRGPWLPEVGRRWASALATLIVIYTIALRKLYRLKRLSP